MIKCKVCENLQQTGNKYICSCNASREVWGELQEEIFKPCTNFKPTNQHRKRQAWVKKNGITANRRQRPRHKYCVETGK